MDCTLPPGRKASVAQFLARLAGAGVSFVAGAFQQDPRSYLLFAGRAFTVQYGSLSRAAMGKLSSTRRAAVLVACASFLSIAALTQATLLHLRDRPSRMFLAPMIGVIEPCILSQG
ncbi:MAG TPA: hypothetical protein VLJ57_22880, partial [Burkholderiaceae bacterium]|nr:hypothetical protein [Burkholderiaceae bacterium]